MVIKKREKLKTTEFPLSSDFTDTSLGVHVFK